MNDKYLINEYNHFHAKYKLNKIYIASSVKLIALYYVTLVSLDSHKTAEK